MTKRLTAILAFLAVPLVFAAAQNKEMSVEESYLQESVENMIIREQSRSDTREMKIIALQYIGDAIDRGNNSDDVRQALEYMGLEGVLNRGRENGRVVNNFPDVRLESAKYLGKMNTPAAKDALLRMIYYDNEPMVLQEAMKSLADIGNDDNGKTVSTITWVLQKYDNTMPDDLLAFVGVDALERLGQKNGGLKDQNALQILMRISEGKYSKAVQDRAKTALSNIRKQTASSSKQAQESSQKK